MIGRRPVSGSIPHRLVGAEDPPHIEAPPPPSSGHPVMIEYDSLKDGRPTSADVPEDWEEDDIPPRTLPPDKGQESSCPVRSRRELGYPMDCTINQDAAVDRLRSASEQESSSPTESCIVREVVERGRSGAAVKNADCRRQWSTFVEVVGSHNTIGMKSSPTSRDSSSSRPVTFVDRVLSTREDLQTMWREGTSRHRPTQSEPPAFEDTSESRDTITRGRSSPAGRDFSFPRPVVRPVPRAGPAFIDQGVSLAEHEQASSQWLPEFHQRSKGLEERRPGSVDSSRKADEEEVHSALQSSEVGRVSAHPTSLQIPLSYQVDVIQNRATAVDCFGSNTEQLPSSTFEPKIVERRRGKVANNQTEEVSRQWSTLIEEVGSHDMINTKSSQASRDSSSSRPVTFADRLFSAREHLQQMREMRSDDYRHELELRRDMTRAEMDNRATILSAFQPTDETATVDSRHRIPPWPCRHSTLSASTTHSQFFISLVIRVYKTLRRGWCDGKLESSPLDLPQSLPGLTNYFSTTS